jgi:hypothetical protein
MCGSRDLQLILRMAPTPPGDHYVTAAQLTRRSLSIPWIS